MWVTALVKLLQLHSLQLAFHHSCGTGDRKNAARIPAVLGWLQIFDAVSVNVCYEPRLLRTKFPEHWPRPNPKSVLDILDLRGFNRAVRDRDFNSNAEISNWTPVMHF